MQHVARATGITMQTSSIVDRSARCRRSRTIFQVERHILQEALACALRLEEVVDGKHARHGVKRRGRVQHLGLAQLVRCCEVSTQSQACTMHMVNDLRIRTSRRRRLQPGQQRGLPN